MLLTPKQAFDQHLRDIFMIADGIIAEILPNDETGVPHQRFILLTPEPQTLLIVNNIEQGQPLDIRVGDKIHVEGTYVWNKYGGLIHETHLGVNKRQPDGLIAKKIEEINK
jgi:hypothetical protein